MRFALTREDRVCYVLEQDIYADCIHGLAYLRGLVCIRGLVQRWMLFVWTRGDRVFQNTRMYSLRIHSRMSSREYDIYAGMEYII